MTKNYLTECRLQIKWDDGQLEQMSIYDLPEYIADELRVYFRELESLRCENKELYDAEYINNTRELTL